MKRFGVFFALVFMAFYAGSVKAEDVLMGMVTGTPTGTYYAFGKDIETISVKEGIAVRAKASNGSVDNIQRISSSENAAFGIVQSDVLGFLLRAEDAGMRNIAENLRMVFPFYKEEVHILAAKDIKDFSDLNGRKVIVGNEGSGSWLTAMNLLGMNSVVPGEILRMNPPEAVVAVLSGEADAMVFVGGKPVKLFKNLEDLADQGSAYAPLIDDVHFLPLRGGKMLEEYDVSNITSRDYAFVKEKIPTIAVRALLVSYDFSNSADPYIQSRCKELKRLGDTIRDHIYELKSSGHPKWKEVQLNTEVVKWKKDKCSEPETTSAKLENELLNTLRSKW